MTVYLVGAGPGRADLMTRRSIELLRVAEVVVVDRLVGDEVLDHINVGARIIDVGKAAVLSGHGDDASTLQATINQILVDEGRSGRCVVRLKGGDPFLFGRGGEEAEALLDAAVPFEVVPGVSSAFALPALAGIPVTHRGVARAVAVVSGHEPVESATVDWPGLASSGATIVVLMGVARRGAIAKVLIDAGLSAATPTVAVERGATAFERVLRTSLAEIGDLPLLAPSVIVIGEVAGFDFRDQMRRELDGVVVGVTRPVDRSEGLSRRLREHGATVAVVPLIATTPIAAGIGQLLARLNDEAIGVLAFSSASSVDPVLDEIADLRRLAGISVAAMGPSTARALAARGIVADVVADGTGGRALAAVIGSAKHGSAIALLASAAEGRKELAEGLRAEGWRVESLPVYRTEATELSSSGREALAAADVIVFASPSAVIAFGEIRDADGRPLAARRCVVIGSTTESAARAAGFDALTVASTASDDGLTDAVLVAASRPRSDA